MAEGDGCPISSREKITFPVFLFHLGPTGYIMPLSYYTSYIIVPLHSLYWFKRNLSQKHPHSHTPTWKTSLWIGPSSAQPSWHLKWTTTTGFPFFEVADFDLAAALRCSAGVESHKGQSVTLSFKFLYNSLSPSSSCKMHVLIISDL